MKTFKIFLIVVFTAVSSMMWAQNEPDKKAGDKEKIASAVKAAVDSGNIEIIIEKIIPKSRMVIDTHREYYLYIKKDSLFCMLPYIGEKDSPEIVSSTMRVEFDDNVVDIKRTDPRPGIHLLKFTQKADVGIETFNFTITIFDSGFCIINLLPSNRDYIIYHGTLKY